MMAQLASRQSFRPGKDLLWPICYWATVAFIFAWAVWQRFKLPLNPIADPDTWGYLSPALRKLTGAEFGHSQSRNFLYPGFLYLVLRCFGDFRAIGVVQHLLGLAAGWVILAYLATTPGLCPGLVSQSFASRCIRLGRRRDLSSRQ